MQLQNDALLVLQLHATGARRQRTARSDGAVGTRNVAWTADIEGTSDQFGGRCSNGEAHAHARYIEGVVVAAEGQHAFAATNADDEPALGENHADRTGFSLRRA